VSRRDTGWMASVPRALTIAGSDSGAGAGIQADLKAFARSGVYGTSVVTAVTAQNTTGVLAVHQVPVDIVRAQLEAVLGDIGADAVKIGMLGEAETVRCVASCLHDLLDPDVPLVIDPVLAASTGTVLLERDAIGGLIELFARARVLTPNVPEARALLAAAGAAVPSSDSDLARAMLGLGSEAVVLTGGHRDTPGDIYCDANQLIELPGTHHPAGATHGSGCTHSALLAAELAKGQTTLQAAQTAARLTADAIAQGLALGRGTGPVDVLGLAEPAETR